MTESSAVHDERRRPASRTTSTGPGSAGAARGLPERAAAAAIGLPAGALLGFAVTVAAVVAASDLQTWETELPDGGAARVVYSATRGEGWFLADGMSTTEAGEIYELWLIDDEGPSPAGLFNASDGLVAHGFTGSVDGVNAIGVTVEPASGSPQPTSDPVMVIEL